ncbi:UAA transporter [Ochromonadaceae sp. CCMP2298]|nr:UAA transporter [Ochromonadaceae sp. CCMP2298]
MKYGKEITLVMYAIGLYATFVVWGYLQERITTTSYIADGSLEQMRWNYPFVLNICMAAGAFVTTSVIDLIWSEKVKVPIWVFWRPALSSCLASPIGYEALKYITYPLLVLTKSSKPVPVMLIGVFFYGRKYAWYKYASVALLCVGIGMFTSGGKGGKAVETDIWLTVLGIAMVLVNLGLDGYTNNEQDEVFAKHSASSNQMMRGTNLWQCFFQFAYLGGGWLLQREQSEISQAVTMIRLCPVVSYDILMFCFCASVGQVLIFSVMKEYGSLVWITISVTRKLITIFVSIFLFNHKVSLVQWMGVALVFGSMALDIGTNLGKKEKAVDAKKKD